MNAIDRLILSLLIVTLVPTLGAQESPAVNSTPDPTPVITAATNGNSVRFSSSDSVYLIRVQVIDADGATIADSNWNDGNVLDWRLEIPGSPLADGVYRCVVSVKDLSQRVSQREAALIAREGRASIELVSGDHAVSAVDGRENGPKVTLLAHDATNGTIVSSAGDLTFRFGNFLAAKESEKMRLTAEGRLGIGTEKPEALLDVNGVIRTGEGILFADGTLLTSQGGRLTTQTVQSRQRADTPSGNSSSPVVIRATGPADSVARRLAPVPSATPAYKLITSSSGVGVWTTTPAYPLDVGGIVNTSDSYYVGGQRAFAADSYYGGVYVGTNTGSPTVGCYNAFFGYGAGSGITWGANNTYVGYSAGGSATGGANVAVGSIAKADGDYNTAVGPEAKVNGGVRNASAFGAQAVSDQNNTIVIGSINGVNYATATASVGIGTSRPNQNLGVGGGITVDEANANDGTYGTNVLSFGTGPSYALSGESISSRRTTGGNRYGLDFYTSYASRLSITQTGNVGIGTTAPTATFEVAATKTTLADAWSLRSSARFKENVQPIESALEKTERLRGVSFDYRNSSNHSVGFIAEEVAQVLPEAVQRDADGNAVGLDYNRITPLLVEALKQQQKVIRGLEERIEKLEAVQGDSRR